MVIAERITSSFGGLLIEPAARENAPGSLNPHHRGTSPGVFDWIFTFEPGFSPMIDVAFAGDVVCGNAVMR
jgi:hypothetical protein